MLRRHLSSIPLAFLFLLIRHVGQIQSVPPRERQSVPRRERQSVPPAIAGGSETYFGFAIADCGLSLRYTPIGVRQSPITNQLTHPLASGTDYLPTPTPKQSSAAGCGNVFQSTVRAHSQRPARSPEPEAHRIRSAPRYSAQSARQHSPACRLCKAACIHQSFFARRVHLSA